MNKLILRIQLRQFYVALFLLTASTGFTQDTIQNKDHLIILKSVIQLQKIVAK